MPRLNQELDLKTIPGSTFQYSSTRLEDLGATEYTLITIVCDVSGSVSFFKDDLEKCLKEIVSSCKYSPRSDNLMIRLLVFNNQPFEIHGFKLLENCNEDDYINILDCDGMTALNDAIINAIESESNYANELVENDYNVNGIIFILTDGVENNSTYGIEKVKNSLVKTIQDEKLESLVSILIGVNIDVDPDIDIYLTEFNEKVGFTQYCKIGEASSKNLAKLAQFVSHSISSQSNSLGTGGASQEINSLTI
ncbi:MAG: hypothetical protein ACFFG0_40825 [Candidatus Thorarchaeota archaeon]